MPPDPALTRYRRWYARLLLFYAKPFHERFGEEMEQTFTDLLCERAKKHQPVLPYALWLLAETSMEIIKEDLTRASMKRNRILVIALVTGLILLIPLIAMQFSDDVVWTAFDFIIAGTMLFSTGLAYELIAGKGGTTAYRAAAAMACGATLLLMWVNAAVGIIGDGPVNMLYLAVPFVLLIGMILSRLKAKNMAKALFATAAAQLLIPFAALIFWGTSDISWSPGVINVFLLNACFAALFVGSGWLFLKSETAMRKQ